MADTDLVFFYPEGHEAHFEPGHPERPARLEAARLGLQEAGWWELYPHLSPLEVPLAVLHSVHQPAYLAFLEQACLAGRRLDANTYTTPASWNLALAAAGGTLAVARQVWLRQARRGFALARPPGHHATRQRGMGFCLLNNIALAAEYLVQEHGAQRLAIVDLDLHHGNGTQDIFWERPDVLYISTHQMPLYPGTGSMNETGEGAGEGYTANIPMPPYSGDQAFQSAMSEVILPLLDRFSPEMVLVSMGFDCHWRDPLGYLLLSAAVYGQLFQALTAWVDEHAQGRIALVLEGGYDLSAAGACTQAATAALLGERWDDPLGPAPHTESPAYQDMVARARKIWRLP